MNSKAATALLQVVMALHILVYRLSRGAWLAADGHIILVSTLGRRTGQMRTVPLYCVRDGEAYVIIASYGGSPTNPGWYFNLEARPRALVVDGDRLVPVSATIVTDADYARHWALLVAANPTYQTYKSRTTRQLPIVRLAPVS